MTNMLTNFIIQHSDVKREDLEQEQYLKEWREKKLKKSKKFEN